MSAWNPPFWRRCARGFLKGLKSQGSSLVAAPVADVDIGEKRAVDEVSKSRLILQ